MSFNESVVTEKKPDTYFASPERKGPEEVSRQSGVVKRSSLVQEMLDALPHLAMAINGDRQVVAVNDALLQALGEKDETAVLGNRPGEILRCIHACEGPGGCGTAEACQTCGAVQAILESQQQRTRAQKECRVTVDGATGNESMELQVTVSPLSIEDGRTFSLLSMIDVSGEKRRRVLERIFFHDVLNTAGGVRGLLDCALEGQGSDEVRQFVNEAHEATDFLVDEIKDHRKLIAAERNDLKLKIEPVDLAEFVSRLVRQFAAHEAAQGIVLAAAPRLAQVTIETDRMLLRRVTVNLLKNACEASTKGQRVMIGLDEPQNGDVSLWVKNEDVMPRAVQLQIFQRSFSTKGEDRGLGTYCVKLLTERYLKGTASFESSRDGGTVFTVRLPLWSAAVPGC